MRNMKENVKITKKKEVQKTLKNEKGITLIALVITIIVLLILAGVSIATLTGQNGILTRANDAKVNTEVADEKEAIGLAYNGVMADNQGKGKVTAEKLKLELSRNGRTDVTDVTGENPITVEFTSGRKYDIYNNGNITENNKVTGDESWYRIEATDTGDGVRIVGFNDEIEELRANIVQELEEAVANEEFESEQENAEFIYDYMKNKSQEIVKKYPGIGNIPSQIGEKNVTEIASNAYMYMPIGELTIPNTVSIIGDMAFVGCYISNEIIIPNSVKILGVRAFMLTPVEKITFLGDIEIYSNAFFGCYNLNHVTFETNNITIENFEDGALGIFRDCPKLIENTIQIPQGSMQNFIKYSLNQWGVSSYNAFYEE